MATSVILAWSAPVPVAAAMSSQYAVPGVSDSSPVNANGTLTPVVPGFTSSRSKVERTIKAIADHGARFVGYTVMHLEGGTRDHFMKFIEQEFPAMLPKLERLYSRKRAPASYRKEVQAMVRVLQDRYGLGSRPESPTADTTWEARAAPPEQVAFAW